MPLRLIVGFKVGDEDFVQRISGGSECPARHTGAGPGPFCSVCGERFTDASADAIATPGAVKLARLLAVRIDAPEQWRERMQSPLRTPGALVVGRTGDTWALGRLIGAYQANTAMRWSAGLVQMYTAQCEQMLEALGFHGDGGRPIELMLIE